MRASSRSSTETPVHSDNLQPISRLTLIHQIILHHDLDTPRQLSRRRSFRHLLNHDHLVVHERRQPMLDLKRVSVGVGLGVGGGGNGGAGGGGGGEAVGVDSGMEVLSCVTVVDGLLHLGTDEVACVSRFVSLP
jgi:hypothetical protein